MNNRDILVTGAYGYIGAHVCKNAHDSGYNVYAIDNKLSSNNISPYCKEIRIADIRSNEPFFNHDFLAVIHCAAEISVEQSMKNPHLYYEVNALGTINTILNTSFENFIFASTGGAFDPISHYAKSKLIAEEAVRTMCPNYNIFRFFNVAGNNGIFGQICVPSHIIHIAAQVAAGKREKMYLFGDDYDTFDGTCVRDYVHVEDLSSAVVKSINTPRNSKYECVGSGAGYSNSQVISAMKKVSGVDFEVKVLERRLGDPAILKVDAQSEFVEINKTIEDMCRSAYRMEKYGS
jgi:UDP-glucose 4-epimerase